MSAPRGRPAWQRNPLNAGLAEPQPAKSATGGGKSPYRLGRDFERSVRGQLERREWFVMRAHGSKGKVDLLAVGKPALALGISGLYIQCKRRGDIGSEEWNLVFEIASRFGGWPVVAMRISERKTGFFRLDGPRERGRRGRPWSMFDPADGSTIELPPSLL